MSKELYYYDSSPHRYGYYTEVERTFGVLIKQEVDDFNGEILVFKPLGFQRFAEDRSPVASFDRRSRFKQPDADIYADDQPVVTLSGRKYETASKPQKKLFLKALDEFKQVNLERASQISNWISQLTREV